MRRSVSRLWRRFSWHCVSRWDSSQTAVAVLLKQIFKAPFIHVNCELFVIDQTASEFGRRIRVGDGILKKRHQVAAYLFGNVAGWCRIDVAKQNKRPEQHFPMFSGEPQNALPSQSSPSGPLLIHTQKTNRQPPNT